MLRRDDLWLGWDPAMILVSGLLILAWRNAGWWGPDRWVLPVLGTPWHRGAAYDEDGDADVGARAAAGPDPPRAPA